MSAIWNYVEGSISKKEYVETFIDVFNQTIKKDYITETGAEDQEAIKEAEEYCDENYCLEEDRISLRDDTFIIWVPEKSEIPVVHFEFWFNTDTVLEDAVYENYIGILPLSEVLKEFIKRVPTVGCVVEQRVSYENSGEVQEISYKYNLGDSDEVLIETWKEINVPDEYICPNCGADVTELVEDLDEDEWEECPECGEDVSKESAGDYAITKTSYQLTENEWKQAEKTTERSRK